MLLLRNRFRGSRGCGYRRYFGSLQLCYRRLSSKSPGSRAVPPGPSAAVQARPLPAQLMPYINQQMHRLLHPTSTPVAGVPRPQASSLGYPVLPVVGPRMQVGLPSWSARGLAAKAREDSRFPPSMQYTPYPISTKYPYLTNRNEVRPELSTRSRSSMGMYPNSSAGGSLVHSILSSSGTGSHSHASLPSSAPSSLATAPPRVTRHEQPDTYDYLNDRQRLSPVSSQIDQSQAANPAQATWRLVQTVFDLNALVESQKGCNKGELPGEFDFSSEDDFNDAQTNHSFEPTIFTKWNDGLTRHETRAAVEGEKRSDTETSRGAIVKKQRLGKESHRPHPEDARGDVRREDRRPSQNLPDPAYASKQDATDSRAPEGTVSFAAPASKMALRDQSVISPTFADDSKSAAPGPKLESTSVKIREATNPAAESSFARNSGALVSLEGDRATRGSEERSDASEVCAGETLSPDTFEILCQPQAPPANDAPKLPYAGYGPKFAERRQVSRPAVNKTVKKIGVIMINSFKDDVNKEYLDWFLRQLMGGNVKNAASSWSSRVMPLTVSWSNTSAAAPPTNPSSMANDEIEDAKVMPPLYQAPKEQGATLFESSGTPSLPSEDLISAVSRMPEPLRSEDLQAELVEALAKTANVEDTQPEATLQSRDARPETSPLPQIMETAVATEAAAPRLASDLSLGMQWSEFQSKIFRFVGEKKGHGLVEARAGTGKTTTILGCLEHVNITKRVLVLAFNRQVADTLNRRIRAKFPSLDAQLMDDTPASPADLIPQENISTFTFHQFGLITWKAFLKSLHPRDEQKLSVELDKDLYIVSAMLGSEDSDDVKRLRLIVLDLMSKAKVHGLLPNKLLVEVAKDPCLAIKIPLPRGLLPDTRESWEEIIRYHSIDLGKRLGEIQFDTTKYKNVFEIASEGLYRSAVWSLGNILEPGRPPHVRMNFDDLLYMPVIMGAPVRALNRYDLVFVDEAQDFSSVRLELVLRIAGLDTDATVKQAKETEIFRANGMQTNDAGMPILDDQSQRGADATECELASEADSRLENPDDEEARVQWASQSRDQETSTSPHPAPGFASDGSTPLQPAKAATAENEAAESPCDAHDPGPVCRIIAVGDEGQAIYRFAGAHSKVLQSFDGLLRPTTFVLPVTYRCATKIVKMANLLVPDLVARPDAERGSIARCDIRDVNLGKNDMVLCRERNPMILYAFHLLRMGRAAEVVGTWIGGLRCVYLARAITCATEEDTRHKLEEWNIKIGEGMDSGFLQRLDEVYTTMVTLMDSPVIKERVLARAALSPPPVGPGTEETDQIPSFHWGDAFIQVLSEMFPEQTHAPRVESHDLIDDHCATLEERPDSESYADPLQWPRYDTMEAPWPVLSTIHAAKGLERTRIVFLKSKGDSESWNTMFEAWRRIPRPDSSNGVIALPIHGRSAEQIIEEKNLIYVAVTRAKQELLIVNTPDSDQIQLGELKDAVRMLRYVADKTYATIVMQREKQKAREAELAHAIAALSKSTEELLGRVKSSRWQFKTATTAPTKDRDEFEWFESMETYAPNGDMLQDGHEFCDDGVEYPVELLDIEQSDEELMEACYG